MKIVFMGTPDYSIPTLQALIDSQHEIVAVYTKPDMPKGRGKKLEVTPVKALALEYNIPVYQPSNFKNEEDVHKFQSHKADLAVVIAYGLILPKSILQAYPFGAINLHASLLPKFRGASPIQAAILAGESKTGVTSMQMDVGLDTGDMLLKSEIDLDGSETAGSLHDQLAEISAKLCLETIIGLSNSTITAKKQTEDNPCYAGKITKDMGKINWQNKVSEIDKQIRAMSPWPSAYTFRQDKILKIWKAIPISENNLSAKAGEVIAINENGIRIACGQGSLLVEEVQQSGKKRMKAADYLNGNPIDVGEIFGEINQTNYKSKD